MTKPENPPAFPQSSPNSVAINPEGMDLRDWFAGMALQGMLANSARLIEKPDVAAMDAYLTADAMLAQREKGDAA